jgi:hypothetical protein
MFHETYVPGMSRFTPSPPEYDAAMHEGISPSLRRGPLSFSHGMPPPNDGVMMHDMITSGSMAAASSPGFFTQEEARATEATAAASRGGVDGLGDATQDVDEEEEGAGPGRRGERRAGADIDVEGEEEKEELTTDRATDQMDGQRRGVPRRSLEDRFHEWHYRRQSKL